MRHGRSRADDEEVHEGRYDSPLTDMGRAQVQQRALLWLESQVTFDCIIASTLQRALESAKIVGAALNVPVEPDPDWMEMDNGLLAGIRWDVARTAAFSTMLCAPSSAPTLRSTTREYGLSLETQAMSVQFITLRSIPGGSRS